MRLHLKRYISLLVGLLLIFCMQTSILAADREPINATVRGDFFYVRNGQGEIQKDRIVVNGSDIAVISIDYQLQLVYIQYPVNQDIFPRGYTNVWIKNVPSLIKYKWANQWKNGATPEPVYDRPGGNVIGKINPRETATPLRRDSGMLYIVYNTIKGANTKAGYVKYNGGFHGF